MEQMEKLNVSDLKSFLRRSSVIMQDLRMTPTAAHKAQMDKLTLKIAEIRVMLGITNEGKSTVKSE
jgi:hypothetical protein